MSGGGESLSGLEQARRLAALSPQTEARLAWREGVEAPEALNVASAFTEIGRAMAAQRDRVSDRDMARLLAEAERLIRSSDFQVSNAVATDLLETLSAAAQGSGFDFSRADPHLGPQCRRYLTDWDDFNAMTTPGLTRSRT